VDAPTPVDSPTTQGTGGAPGIDGATLPTGSGGNSGTTLPIATGGAPGAGGTTLPISTGGTPGTIGTTLPVATGGAPGTGGNTASTTGQGGSEGKQGGFCAIAPFARPLGLPTLCLFAGLGLAVWRRRRA
jgi:hypothetical protein